MNVVVLLLGVEDVAIVSLPGENFIFSTEMYFKTDKTKKASVDNVNGKK